jgi:hypothetical protein
MAEIGTCKLLKQDLRKDPIQHLPITTEIFVLWSLHPSNRSGLG